MIYKKTPIQRKRKREWPHSCGLRMWDACASGCVYVSYHTTKMRERTVVRMTTENKTSRITNPKLPSSSGTTSGWEKRGKKQQGRSAKQSGWELWRKRKLKQQKGEFNHRCMVWEENRGTDAWRHRCGEIKKIQVEKPKTNIVMEGKMKQMGLYCHNL